MTATEGKEVCLEKLVTVRAKRDKLPNDSPVRQALNDAVLDQIKRKIDKANPVDLQFDYWPPLYSFCALKSLEAIAALDSDIRLVNRHSNPSKILGVTQFLNTGAGKRHGDWYGGLFDLWTKATTAGSDKPFEFDFLLSNGRDHDVRLQLNERRFHIESTVLTPDDESEEVWKRFLEDKRLDPSKVLTRPGPYCPPSAKGPSPYYMTLRVYAKVFDKLTKDLNPTRGQVSDDEPNVLLVSFSGPGVRSDKPGVGWALDELFADQPKIARTIIPESFTDISLDAWVDFRAKELMGQGRMTIEWFCEHSHEAMAAPRRLGAVLLFDGCRLKKSRINYNADDCCAITHGEMAELEKLFDNDVAYWR